MPWPEWVAIIEPYYPKIGEVGRQPIVIKRILFVQHYYNLSDELTEEMIDDSRTLRRFVGIGPPQRVPDAKNKSCLFLLFDGRISYWPDMA